ncbi:FAD-binding protein [Nocardioides convexus]|uniref:FAD-binding protein n=1 Tax=Nocardioides convexus TaxID=2712224 RepID=UPI0024182C2F|nr:FAD-binding protein [Nocardioides convexus]
MKEADAVAYLIVDSAHLGEDHMPLVPLKDGFETIEEMEAGLGMPAGALVATIERYNDHAARGEDPDFHKHPDWLTPQTEGPWAVLDLSLGVALYAGFTIGGMATTVDGEVRRADGSVVPGLYAAGACASNIAQDGSGYCSGTQARRGLLLRPPGRPPRRHPPLTWGFPPATWGFPPATWGFPPATWEIPTVASGAQVPTQGWGTANSRVGNPNSTRHRVGT